MTSGGTCWGGESPVPSCKSPHLTPARPQTPLGCQVPPLGGTFGSCSCASCPGTIRVPPSGYRLLEGRGGMLRLGGFHTAPSDPQLCPQPWQWGGCSFSPPLLPQVGRWVLGAPPPLPSGRAGARGGVGGGDSSGLALCQPPGLAQTIAAPARLPGAGDARSSRSLRSRSAARPRLRRGTRAPAAAPSVARRAAEGAAGSCCLATGHKAAPKPPPRSSEVGDFPSSQLHWVLWSPVHHAGGTHPSTACARGPCSVPVSRVQPCLAVPSRAGCWE